ncbi:HlyC/CorC family transporter [Methylocystis sp. MJC1]|jgi:Mg2+/Co2+ transporter CorB|uniref:HlyC/CorC family transporter n=1 Tax=Methylocystis sp. MJC1 TaxID=2654282 RepID=UPI0013EB8456|nr:HlyC/CorC family transporter [Methylocystis sp. MJC1]KAF2988948.1 Magnesium and cobalt efflux protein CorC [Methylocystis sp. MJC1]MBU6528870.1 HlyC/CorC family transporter [Methylocystis sp. MJC1]UZX11754.1 HlyC/CorC family transporter [Methylocystis sp. MJC1]
MHGLDSGGGGSFAWTDVLVVIACVLLSAFFSGSETALTAASHARMHTLEKEGDKRAGAVNRLLRQRNRMIAALLLGSTLVNIGGSAFTTSVLTAVAGENGAVYATILMTALLLVFAEVLPKTLAINHPDAMSLRVARFITPFVSIFGPVLAAVEWFVRIVLGLVGVELSHGRTLISPYEELKGAVDILHEEGEVERSARDMFGGVLDLQVLHVADVMIHRTKMRTIDADLPPVQIVREVLSSPFTRLPLWRERPDNFVGVLHSKDLLRALDAAGGDAAKIDIDEVMFAPWFVPEATTLEDQLEAFLKRKTHFALVVDEYGEVMGLVTLEDILEEIVGDIRDEHDLAVQGVRPQPDGSVLVDGAVPVRDLNRVMAWSLPDEEATTIAGLVIHEAGAIPEAGQVFTFHGFRFEVMRRIRNRVTALRVTPQEAEAGI